MTPPANWQRLADARQITGHKTVSALSQWISRWNLANPDCLIWRRHGSVETVSLQKALHREAVTYTPGMAERAAAIRRLTQSRVQTEKARPLERTR